MNWVLVYPSIFLVAISLSFLTPQAFSEEMSLEEMQIIKTEKEIKLLEKEFSLLENQEGEDMFDITFFTESLALIGIVAGGLITGFFAWRREKNIATPIEQVRAFNEIIIETNFELYLDLWRKYWQPILRAQNAENPNEETINKVIKDVWKNLPQKGSKDEENEDDEIWSNTIRIAWKKAKRMNLNHILSIDFEDYKEESESLQKIAKVRYYQKVNELSPKLVSKAVQSTYKPIYNLEDEEKLKKWEESALTSLKALMIFSFLRENEKIMQTMIRSEIKNILLEKN